MTEHRRVTVELLPYAKTRQQMEVATLYDSGASLSEIAKQQGRNLQNVGRDIKTMVERAAKKGDSPEYDLKHPAAPGFATKRVSTLYNASGEVSAQWHIQEPEKQEIDKILQEFVAAYTDEMRGQHKPTKPPKNTDSDYASCYLIGDHHLGMYAWSEETGGDDYDTDIAEQILADAVDRLVNSQSIKSEHGWLISLGDFMHANDTTSMTPASKHLLDTDGRFGRVIRVAARLYKRMVKTMLERHKHVTIFNVRGNHDPDASLMINALLQGYYENDPRVTVVDNYSKFLWKKWGQCLVTMHHGDRVQPQRLYEAITANLSKEWGETSYRVCWTGHLHSKLAVDLGGMNFERWNVLPPNDAWAAGAAFTQTEQMRSMTCVVLHKEFGEELRYKVGIRRLRDRKIATRN